MNKRENAFSPDLQTILCAEDDEGYALLIKCAIQAAGLSHKFHHVYDGAEAISYLKGEGKYRDRVEYPLPCVVMADLKMPKINGFELMEWIRKHSDVPHLPIVVLTLSDQVRDIQKAYSLGANSFLVKPPNIKDLKDLVKMIDQYWFKHNAIAGKVPHPRDSMSWESLRDIDSRKN